MKRIIFSTVISFFILLFFVQSADAQFRRRRPVRRHVKTKRIEIPAAIGIQGGNDFKADKMFAGAHLWLPLGIFWRFVPSAEYVFTKNDSTQWQFNSDFVFKPSVRGGLYLGAGVASRYLNDQTNASQWDFGGNLLVGFDFSGLRPPAMSPYIQARWTIIDKETNFSLIAGLNFVLR